MANSIIKNYGLSGVHRILQLGKRGPKLIADTANGTLTATTVDGETLTTMSGANAALSIDFVTKAQLDVVQNSEGTLSSDFSFSNTSILLGTVPAGNKTVITTVNITTGFNSNTATITVGDGVTAGLFMANNYNDPSTVQNYQTVCVVDFAVDTAIYVTVTAAGSTQGAGTVTVSFN